MIYRFDDYVFDADRGDVRLGDEVINLGPQALTVLGYLIAHRHRVVSRDELFEQCWPESYVSDASLTSCLSRLRQALGQTHSGPTFIQTLHRRGYRFIAEVEEVAETVVPSSADDGVSSDLPTPSLQPPASPPESAVPTERRHLSVLSCALCDIDALAQQLDPEDYYELMQAFFRGVSGWCRRMRATWPGNPMARFWCTLAIRRPRKTRPSGRCAPAWRWLKASDGMRWRLRLGPSTT